MTFPFPLQWILHVVTMFLQANWGTNASHRMTRRVVKRDISRTEKKEK
ncbi:MAG: hypothetical protein KDA87_10030 [Planctomycetales bacterium]|nr:hypothetical protein [Planctomycetales bacterium]